MNKKILKLFTVATFLSLGVISSTYAMAPGFYFGIQAGKTFTHNKPVTLQTCGAPTATPDPITGELVVSDGCPNAGSTNHDDVNAIGTETLNPSTSGAGFRFLIGSNVTQFWGWEAGFTHYALSTITVPASPPLTIGNPTGNPAITTNAFDFVGKGMFQVSLFSYGFGVYGKAGIAIARVGQAGTYINTFDASKGTFYTNPNNPASTYPGTYVTIGSRGSTFIRPTAGFGITFDITQNVQTEFVASRIFGGGGMQTADFVGLGLTYHVVDKFCGQFLC